MKIKPIIFSLIISTSSFANNIQEWKEYVIPYSYILSLDIVKHKKCAPTKEIMKLIKEKNLNLDLNKLRIGDRITLPICNNVDSLYQASNIEPQNKNYPDIVDWIETTVKSGYTLSEDLHFNKECSKIWTKQIYEFKNKNPKIKNPNVLQPKEKILVQKCGPTPEQLVQEVAKENSSEKIAKVVEQYMENNYLVKDGWQVEFYLGASYWEELAQGVGVGIRGNLYNNYGIDMRSYSFGDKMLLLPELEFKSDNFKVQRNFAVGIGEQFLNERRFENESIAWWSYGYIFRPTSHKVFEINLGTNFSNRIHPNLEIQGLKRMKGDWWMGWYGELRSLNGLNSDQDRDTLYLTGLKLSF